MQNVSFVTDADVAGKRVLVRAGFDVPTRDGVVQDFSRIDAVIPTIRLLLERGASVVLLAHQGRPKSANDTACSQRPVADALASRMQMPVQFCPQCFGPEAASAVNALHAGEVLLLENLRFDPREKQNDEGFAAELASYGDIYVNEAFPNAHRSHASMVALPRLLPSFAGLHLAEEIRQLRAVSVDAVRPLMLVVSGAKMETKVPVLRQFLQMGDVVAVGGAIANTLLKASGVNVGRSLVDDAQLDVAQALLELSHGGGAELVLPADVAVIRDGETESRPCDTAHIDVADACVDVGPSTVSLLEQRIAAASTVVWNGPLGRYEEPSGAAASIALAHALEQAAQRGCTVVIGGGDTIDLHRAYDLPTSAYTFVSMGGGAMLSFLAGETLPSLDVLRG